MNVSLVTAKDGVVTVHRETCKKIEDRTDLKSVDEVLAINPGALTTAKKASCCKPTDAVLSEVEQAGWDALEEQANANAEEALVDPDEDTDNDDEVEDLIGGPVTVTLEDPDEDEDLIGTPAPTPAKGKAATKVAAAKTAAKELNGLEALGKVADHLGLDVGKKPVFPGFGKAFKTGDKQSVYVNSKGNADVRATDSAQADSWASLDHVERRSGNYVRVNLAAL